MLSPLHLLYHLKCYLLHHHQLHHQHWIRSRLDHHYNRASRTRHPSMTPRSTTRRSRSTRPVHHRSRSHQPHPSRDRRQRQPSGSDPTVPDQWTSLDEHTADTDNIPLTANLCISTIYSNSPSQPFSPQSHSHIN